MPTPTVKVAPVVKAVPAVAPVKKTEAPKALVKPVAKETGHSGQKEKVAPSSHPTGQFARIVQLFKKWHN